MLCWEEYDPKGRSTRLWVYAEEMVKHLDKIKKSEGSVLKRYLWYLQDRAAGALYFFLPKTVEHVLNYLPPLPEQYAWRTPQEGISPLPYEEVMALPYAPVIKGLLGIIGAVEDLSHARKNGSPLPWTAMHYLDEQVRQINEVAVQYREEPKYDWPKVVNELNINKKKAISAEDEGRKVEFAEAIVDELNVSCSLYNICLGRMIILAGAKDALQKGISQSVWEKLCHTFSENTPYKVEMKDGRVFSLWLTENEIIRTGFLKDAEEEKSTKKDSFEKNNYRTVKRLFSMLEKNNWTWPMH